LKSITDNNKTENITNINEDNNECDSEESDDNYNPSETENKDKNSIEFKTNKRKRLNKSEKLVQKSIE
jgi:hypothetical protein